MLEDQDRNYSSGEVCRAVGLSRPTFDAWLLRQYLPPPLGPSTGRSRTYSLLDAVRISVVFELSQLGINAGTAARFSGLIVDSSIAPATTRRTALILVPSPGLGHDGAEQRGPAVAVHQFESWKDIESALRKDFVDGPPAGFVMLDVTTVADRTRAALNDVNATSSFGAWLDARAERVEAIGGTPARDRTSRM
jgi:MerR HTH family regulatory protein